MPWHIDNEHPACPASRPFGVVKDSDGELEGCHPSKAAAQKQLAALYSSEETRVELHDHMELVKRHSRDFGIAWLALGMDPFHPVDQIPTMPKARYAVMRSYLPPRGSRGREMMQATATVQANYPFSEGVDMIAKMRPGVMDGEHRGRDARDLPGARALPGHGQ